MSLQTSMNHDCKKCGNQLILKTYPCDDPESTETEFKVYECEVCKIQFDICPKCGLTSLEHGYDSTMMGQFEWDKCYNSECNYNEITSSKMPGWMIEETRESKKHRHLPSGDIEYADEYGGY